jgi:hypothetical protein
MLLLGALQVWDGGRAYTVGVQYLFAGLRGAMQEKVLC